jgi:hypothetical protein
MMDVPVDNEHALHAPLLSGDLGCDRHVVEETEAHGTSLLGVVSWGTVVRNVIPKRTE